MILHAGDEKFEITPDKILNVEAIAVKRKTGLDFKAWMQGLEDFDAEAVTALVWIAKKRIEPNVRYEDISFPLAQVEFELTEDEQAAAESATGPKAETETATANI